MNWKKLKFFLPIFVALTLVITGLVAVVGSTSANGEFIICHVPGNEDNPQTLSLSEEAAEEHLENHELDYEGPCEEASPTPTPTPTPTPSPTPNPCDENNNPISFWNFLNIDVEATQYDPSPTPSPTPCPSPSPEPTPTPTPPAVGGEPSVGGDSSGPACPTDRPQQIDQVWFSDVKPGEVTVHWANKDDTWGFQIAYGPSKDNLIWGVEVADSKANQFTLKDLPAGELWVSVIAKSSKECGGPRSEPKVVGQVLGAQVLGATGVNSSLPIFSLALGLITTGLWQAKKALDLGAKRA